MVLITCQPADLLARMRRLPLFADATPDDLNVAAAVATLLRLAPAEALGQRGTVLSGFCVVLDGSLRWADTKESLPWVHPARVAAGDALPATLCAGDQGAECMYVPQAAFLDLLDNEPTWTVAMLEAMGQPGIWR